MNSLSDIWQIIMDQLSTKLTPTAVNTWFADCVPIELSDNKLVIQAATDFKKQQIKSRYTEIIQEILADLFSCQFELVVLAGEEVEEYTSQQKTKNIIPEALEYTFDRFIVGPSNNFAHSAAMAVSENLGTIYNPLFIYGNSGLGKTHLMLAIGHAVQEKNPNINMVYIKAEAFSNDLINSIREGTTEEFRRRYRNADLFLIDDIQYIAGKTSTQEEFFHTFNTIYESGHQIVITSDRPPKEMPTLVDRLRTRFEGGLMADIQPPDLETRVAIIKKKSEALGLLLPDDVIYAIAEKITTNIRQIEGVIKRLCAYSMLEHNNITTESVKRAITDVIQEGEFIPSPELIIEETCKFFGVDEKDARGQKRSKNISMARQVSMYLMRTLRDTSLSDIGKNFDNRNHSTVLSSIRKIEETIKADPNIASAIRDISANIVDRHKTSE